MRPAPEAEPPPIVDGGATVDVAVIGAGQAGLAIGYFLARQGRRFVIVDGADAVGAAWRNRWDSLILFTPRRYNSLPGLAFPGDPDGYPTRDEVITYLENYSATFALPVQLNSTVRSLTKQDETFVLNLDDHTIKANQVVVASGPFQTPRVPSFAGELGPERSKPTAPTTARRATCRPASCLSSEAGTLAFKSPASFRQPMTFIFRSARGRPHCRRDSLAETCSGG